MVAAHWLIAGSGSPGLRNHVWGQTPDGQDCLAY